MGAYHNALREEGSRDDLLWALEKAWADNERLKAAIVPPLGQIDYLKMVANLTAENERLREDFEHLRMGAEEYRAETVALSNQLVTFKAENEWIREAAREVLQISDRKHDAWDRLRATLAHKG